MIIIAIDPGYDRIGWAIGQIIKREKINLLSFGLITTDKKKSFFERYLQIENELQKILIEFKPQEAAIESLFFFKNQKTVMQVSESRGIIISAFLRANARISEYTPPQIKAAVTGFGRADKKAVEKMVRLQLKIPEDEVIIDDTFDALAILLTHVSSRKLQLISKNSIA